MTRQVVFRPQAEDEVLAARQWYESRRAGLGQEFAQAVDVLVGRIVGNPLVFPRVRDEIRLAVLSRFPCAIYFRLTDETIIVLAVHGRQNPTRWQRRS